MSAISLPLEPRALPLRAKRRPLTLEEQMQAAGMPVPDPALVREHKRTALVPFRPGIWKFLGPFVIAFNWIMLILLCAGGLIVATGVFWIIVYLVRGMSPTWWVYQTLFGLFLMLPGEVMIRLSAAGKLKTMERAGSHWASIRLRVSGICAPRNITARARFAQALGYDIYVESFVDDPFLYAQKGRFGRRIYIGAWNTGNSALDSPE